jgi:hypothetical protein
LKNNINFSDRASQTYNNPCRVWVKSFIIYSIFITFAKIKDIALMTEPPEKKTFSGQANQYIIYLSYIEHQEYLAVSKFRINKIYNYYKS